jgi:hypothetical protein
MATKSDTLDCIAVKRRAQRKLAQALAGKTPEEQVETLRRMAAQDPRWKQLTKPRRTRAQKTGRTPGKRRSTG